MTPDVARRLLELNRSFYAAAAADFDATRRHLPAGMARAVALLPELPSGRVRRVLDVGCGNGRLLHALRAQGAPADYVGLDADAGLLALAAESAADTNSGGGRIRFVQADLARPSWATTLGGERFDAVFCLATLHHFPGEALRVRLVRDLAACLAAEGWLILSTWQFFESERLRRRIAPWDAIDLSDADVEPGDALLPWDRGVHALRYAHSIDEDELRRLAAAAGLAIDSLFHADGREGTLNLYAALSLTGASLP